MWIAALLISSTGLRAQLVNGQQAEVLVSDQGASQRSSAYWLALDEILQRDLPGFEANPQRKEVLNEATKYVQSFRYKRVDPLMSESLLATRKVREGAEATSVIQITFPDNVAALVQQRLAPQPLVEETIEEVESNVLALVAVDQDGAQFIIGGERGKKFQSRMVQLGVANSLDFEFPVLDDADLAVIQPTDILYNQVDRLEAVMARYDTTRRMTGALFRLSADAWQSEWRFSVPGYPERMATLTTATLDEALITAISELANKEADNFAAGSIYQNGDQPFQRSGVGVRIENISNLADYKNVLSMLRTIDSSVVTESLESGATVFRAKIDSSVLRDALSRQQQLSPLPFAPDGSGELGFRFQTR
ncbi:hypothetical protein AB833_02825 [Chromatiales bacterium (ex Bugula neritina AB1)]|nr:hypothetical protein AB833_02825 [Chromatiales bacterium (ex Bugula neritina AB1)]